MVRLGSLYFYHPLQHRDCVAGSKWGLCLSIVLLAVVSRLAAQASTTGSSERLMTDASGALSGFKATVYVPIVLAEEVRTVAAAVGTEVPLIGVENTKEQEIVVAGTLEDILNSRDIWSLSKTTPGMLVKTFDAADSIPACNSASSRWPFPHDAGKRKTGEIVRHGRLLATGSYRLARSLLSRMVHLRPSDDQRLGFRQRRFRFGKRDAALRVTNV
jgi:hypothetical protein